MPISRSMRALLLAAISLSAVLVPLAPSGAGKSINEIDKEIKAVREAARESSEAESKALLSYADSLSRLKTANAVVAKAELELAEAQQKLEAAAAEYNRLAAASDAVSRRLEDNQRESNARTDYFDSLVRSMYARGAHPPSTAPGIFIQEGDSIAKSTSAEQYYRVVTAWEQGELDQLTQLRAEQMELREQLESERAAADAARVAAEEQRNLVDAVASRLAAARDAVAGEEASKKKLLAAIQEQQSAYEARLKALETESNKLKEELKRSQSTGPMKGNGKFKYPVNGPITSYFGNRTHPIYGATRMHNGLDFGSSCGTPIRAAGPGTIIRSSYYGGYGNTVIIDHGGGFATLYGHASSLSVSVGDEVAQGDTVSKVGSTGASTGCHLHFEVRINGDPVNPLAYL